MQFRREPGGGDRRRTMTIQRQRQMEARAAKARQQLERQHEEIAKHKEGEIVGEENEVDSPRTAAAKRLADEHGLEVEVIKGRNESSMQTRVIHAINCMLVVRRRGRRARRTMTKSFRLRRLRGRCAVPRSLRQCRLRRLRLRRCSLPGSFL
jgi:hypothetical protein